MATKEREGRKMKKMVVGLLALAVLGMSSPSYALTMFVNDLTTAPLDVLVTDNGAGDINPVVGAITYSSPLGNWVVNVVTGLSKPIVGGANNPEMDLNSVNVSSSSGGQIRVGIADSGFLAPENGGTAGPFELTVGGTTDGSVFFQAYGDPGNDEDFQVPYDSYFAMLGPYSGGKAFPFSGSTSGSFSSSTPFGLILVGDITHTGAGTTSFDANLHTGVPEPGTMLLLGSGLLGLGLMRRRKQVR